MFLRKTNNKLLHTDADVSLLDGPSSTLSQRIKHGGAEELFGFEKCEFNGIVQTHAISTLHFALATNTHTLTYTNTHTRLQCE